MSSDDSIQRKARHIEPPPDSGFNHDKKLIKVVQPDIYFDDPPLAPQMEVDPYDLVTILIEGTRNAREISQRVLILAMLLKHPLAPPNYTQLSMWLEVSPPTAKKIFLAIFQCLRAQNRNLLLPPPIGDE